MKKRFFTPRQAAELLGMSRRSVDDWIRTGRLKADARQGPKQKRFRLAYETVFQAASGKRFRRVGASLNGAGDAMAFLDRFTMEELEAEFARGNTCLMVVGDFVAPQLFPREAFNKDTFLDCETTEDIRVRIAVIDIERIHAWLKTRATVVSPLNSAMIPA